MRKKMGKKPSYDTQSVELSWHDVECAADEAHASRG
jgi:hypothetical protein